MEDEKDAPHWRAPERLPRRSRALGVSAENASLRSAASAWKVAIKHGLGRLELPESPDTYIPQLVARTGLRVRGTQ